MVIVHLRVTVVNLLLDLIKHGFILVLVCLLFLLLLLFLLVDGISIWSRVIFCFVVVGSSSSGSRVLCGGRRGGEATST